MNKKLLIWIPIVGIYFGVKDPPDFYNEPFTFCSSAVYQAICVVLPIYFYIETQL